MPQFGTEALKQLGLWEKFYGEPQDMRDRIVAGDVELGWTRDEVYMAWGGPFQKQRLTGRQATRSELLIYRFEVDKDGYATPFVGKKEDYKAVRHYQAELILDDGARAAADAIDLGPLPGRSLRRYWMPVRFDADAAWNRGTRRGRLELALRIGGQAQEPVTWPVSIVFPSPYLDLGVGAW